MTGRPSLTKTKLKKKSIAENDNVLDTMFIDLEPAIFCPIKVFDVIFIEESSEACTEALDSLIRCGKDHEEIACLTFITRDEVLELLDHFDPKVFPPSFQTIIEDIHRRIRSKSASLDKPSALWMASLVKLKLVEVMSRHFLKETSKMEKRNMLENELGLLAQDSKKTPKKKERPVLPEAKKSVTHNKNLVEKKSNRKLDVKSIVAEEIGCKLLSTGSDIVFDDDVLNHVWFYVFTGFLDADVIKKLHAINVPVRAVVELKAPPSTPAAASAAHAKFWGAIQAYFDGPNRCPSFEDTILMQFNAAGETTKDVFESLVYVIKNITDIKLRHLDYIRCIKIQPVEVNHKPTPLDCFPTYTYASDQVAVQLSGAATVLVNVLLEINARAACADPWSRISSRSISLTQLQHCRHLDEDFWKEERTPNRKPRRSFMVHEHDFLGTVLKTYRSCGASFYDSLSSVLKLQKPFTLLETAEEAPQDVIHKHDVNPSDQLEPLSKTQLHLLYLFLFSSFKHQDAVEGFQGTDLTANLQTYKPAHPPCPVKDTCESDCQQLGANLYQPNPMAFAWREELPSQVMLQEIWNNQLLFQYAELKFSPETDNLLVQFWDRLDAFGVNVKNFDVTLKTPVCLRDFCKYVTVEESGWLETNKPPKYVRKSEELEECKGAKAISKLDMFKEYRYLLDPNEKQDVEVQEVRVEAEDNTVSFEQMMLEIENYPSSSKLMEMSDSNRDKAFLAYDLGTRYFAVRGTETVFTSHDGVRIKVDNTRMIHEEPKCTVSLACKGHNLVLHSSKALLDQDYCFHWRLEDGTIVTFTLREQQQKLKPTTPPAPSPEAAAAAGEAVAEPEDDMDWLEAATHQKVIKLNKAEFEAELELLGDAQIGDLPDEDISNVFDSLKLAVMDGSTVYKIRNNLTYFSERYPRTEVPLTSVLRRLLHNTKKEASPECHTKRFLSSSGDSGVKLRKALDFRVCLPNGLYITCYPSNVRGDLVEIKQEFVSDERRVEEFRLFTRDGRILVKRIDGTITVMKSNGDSITFQKPNCEDPAIRESNLKRCHCKSFDDYRKKLNKLMKNAAAKDKCYISRRDIYRTKKGYVINKDIAAVLDSNKVPYLKTVLLSFDGKVTTLRGNKITQRKVFYTTSEQDFVAEEIYFERDDGFRSLFEKNGNQAVRFADGTKISTSIRVSKELVDGYVFVSLDFSYEHPEYVRVTYDAGDKVGLHFKGATLERNATDDMELRLGEDVVSRVGCGKVTLEKLCTQCHLSYCCSFDIRPFAAKDFDPEAEFLHAQDSYDKHFHADFGGSTKRSKCYFSGPLNKAGCNHYKNNAYKKLFVVNRTFSGEHFLDESMVSALRDRAEADIEAEVVAASDTTKPELTVLDIRKQHFESLYERFINTSLVGEEMCLTKYRTSFEREPLYSTFRVFRQMLDNDSTTAFLASLSLHFAGDHEGGALREVIDEHFLGEAPISTKKTKSETAPEETTKECRCLRKKRSFKDKIALWRSECEKHRTIIRERRIPLYFESQFCKVVQ